MSKGGTRRAWELQRKADGICIECGEKHDRGTFRCRKCSRKSYARSRTAPAKPRELKCSVCGSELTSRQAYLWRQRRRRNPHRDGPFCSRKCFAKSQRRTSKGALVKCGNCHRYTRDHNKRTCPKPKE